MSFIDLILIALGLAMDAFAVSIGKGLSMKQINYKNIITVGLYFGIFQGLMPLIGYFLGKKFENLITSIDHWVAFVLLLIIGINMIREIFKKEDEEVSDKFDFKTMFPLAIATSIDALAVGITFAFLKINIFSPSVFSLGLFFFIQTRGGRNVGFYEKNRLLEKMLTIADDIIIIN